MVEVQRYEMNLPLKMFIISLWGTDMYILTLIGKSVLSVEERSRLSVIRDLWKDGSSSTLRMG